MLDVAQGVSPVQQQLRQAARSASASNNHYVNPQRPSDRENFFGRERADEIRNGQRIGPNEHHEIMRIGDDTNSRDMVMPPGFFLCSTFLPLV